MPGTTVTALPSFSHDQHHKTDAAKRKGGGGRGIQYARQIVFLERGSVYKPCLQKNQMFLTITLKVINKLINLHQFGTFFHFM